MESNEKGGYGVNIEKLNEMFQAGGKTSRDVNRMEGFLQEIKKIWEQYPDLRFGQMITDFEYYVKTKGINDLYYLEEDEFLKLLEEYMADNG